MNSTMAWQAILEVETASVWLAVSTLVLLTRVTGLAASELGAGEVRRLEESGIL